MYASLSISPFFSSTSFRNVKPYRRIQPDVRRTISRQLANTLDYMHFSHSLDSIYYLLFVKKVEVYAACTNNATFSISSMSMWRCFIIQLSRIISGLEKISSNIYFGSWNIRYSDQCVYHWSGNAYAD